MNPLRQFVHVERFDHMPGKAGLARAFQVVSSNVPCKKLLLAVRFAGRWSISRSVSEARVGRALAQTWCRTGVLQAGVPATDAAGQALSRASHLGGEAIGRQPRVQLGPAQVVPEYVGAPALVWQPHPHNLIEAAGTA